MATGPSSEELITGATVTATIAILSWLSSWIIVASFTAFRELRTYHNRLVLYLAVFDIVWGATVIPQTFEVIYGRKLNENPDICTALGTITNWIRMSSNIWSGFIAFTMYMEVVLNRTTAPYEKKVFCGTLVYSGIHTILAGAIFGMAPGGSWCFINTVVAQQVLFYYVIYGLMVLILVLYGRIIAHIILFRKTAFGNIEARQWRAIRRLTFYPVWFIIVWLPAIIRRTYEISHSFNFALYLVMVATAPMEGLLNFFAYCVTRSLVPRWLKFFGVGCTETTPSASMNSTDSQEEVNGDVPRKLTLTASNDSPPMPV